MDETKRNMTYEERKRALREQNLANMDANLRESLLRLEEVLIRNEEDEKAHDKTERYKFRIEFVADKETFKVIRDEIIIRGAKDIRCSYVNAPETASY